MKTYKYFLSFIFILSLLHCASEFVETTPTASIPGDRIITDLASAESALNGVYSGLQANQIFGGYETFYTGMYADELVHTGSFPSFAEIAGNDPALNNTDITSYWTAHYFGIFRANFVIENVARTELNLPEEDQKRIGGQARATRALMYYKLVKIYGGVPIVSEANTTLDEINATAPPRSSIAEVYNFILEDLKYAEENLPDNLGLYFFNKNAVRVLKAKIEMELGHYEEAESTLDPLLSAGYVLEKNYQDLFGEPATGTGLIASQLEGVFAIDFAQTDPSSLAFFYLGAGRGEVGASAQLINAFEENDVRKNLITSNGEVGKYGDPGNGSDENYVFRYADVLLMKAELLARRNDPAASDYLNQVRNRAGLGNIQLNAANFVDIIAHERFVELFAESSDRLFTIQRLGLADEIISNKPGSVFIAERNNLWPIPQQEIERNPQISESDQNPGY